MNWLNLETNVLHSPEFVGCKPVSRATWLAVSLWCAGQENGGRIVGAKAWGSRQWQQTCGVTLKEVSDANPLLSWDGDDLLVWNYPTQREAEVQAKRAAGREGGLRSGEARGQKPRSTASSNGSSSASTEGKGKEEERKEGEGSPPLADFVRMVAAIKPGIPDHFVRGKYFGKLESCDGVIRNPQFFAAKVAAWWDEKKTPAPTKPHTPRLGPTAVEQAVKALEEER